MKIVYMGTPDFAVKPLEALLQSGHEIVAVVTQPDKPKGRSSELIPPPVKQCALAHGIEVFQPVKIKSEEAVAKLRTWEADLFVVAAFGQLLSKEILDMPRFGCINIHASLLPKYRGAAPIQWAIINGEQETGVTIMQMDVGLDTGDILSQRTVPISPQDTGESMFDKLCEVGSSLLVETIPKLEKGQIVPRRQEGEKSSYAGMLTKELGNIDFAKSADTIDCLIRGLNSWPSAYTFYQGKRMKIWRAEPIADEAAPGEKKVPGTLLHIGKEYIDVQTGSGILRMYEIQLEGKKRMTLKDFMLGHTWPAHTVFPS